MLRILLNDGLDKKAISNLELLGFDVDTNHYDIEDLKENKRSRLYSYKVCHKNYKRINR